MGFNQQTLQKIMSDPSSISEKELEELQHVVIEYPYFQLGHTFIAKAKHDRQAPDASETLHLAAIYAPSRRRLKHLFYGEFQNPASDISPTESSTRSSAEKPIQAPDANTSEQLAAETKTTGQDASAPEKIRESSDNIYKELEENLQHVRTSRKSNVENKAEDDSSDKKKEGYSEETRADKPTSGDPEVQSDDQKQSTYKVPYLLDYLQDIEPIQSDRLGINQQHQRELIDKFMNSERDVRVRWRYQEKEPEDLSEKSKGASGSFVTENLADIYVRQGKKEKAVDIYQKLILKYPHKKTYFAEKIESLKEK